MFTEAEITVCRICVCLPTVRTLLYARTYLCSLPALLLVSVTFMGNFMKVNRDYYD
jgi:hypothetical protein